jgi:hypothetical protein
MAAAGIEGGLTVYRYLRPETERDLPLGMLLQPNGEGSFQRACEADSWRGLVAAIIDDPGYETATIRDRLMQRLRLAHDVVFVVHLQDNRSLRIADQDGPDTVNVSSDEPLIRSLDRLGYVALEPALAARATDQARGFSTGEDHHQ